MSRARLLPPAVVLAGALLLLAAPPRAARAQQPAPLTKSDVVRLLVDPAYSSSDVAELVRSRCLSFEPTSGDLEDFRRLGAGSDLAEAIRFCRERAPAEARGGQGEAGAREPLRLELSRDSLVARAGELVVFAARVDRGGIPVSGLSLVVRGSGDLVGGAGSDVAAVTDSSGTALFRLPVGRAPGRYGLEVVGGEESPSGEGSVSLTVLSGPAARAVVRPSVLEIGPGTPDTARVRVAVSDSFGNAVPSSSVSLVLPAEESGGGRWSAYSDSSGTAVLRVPVQPLREGGDTLQVVVDGRRLAGVPVSLATAEAARPAATDEALAALADSAGRLLEADDAGEALALYERVLARRPEDPDALAGRAEALLALGRAGEAADGFRAALAAAPDRTGLWLELGRSYEAAGRPSEAREAYGRALAAGGLRAERARSAIERLKAVRGPAYVEASVWEGRTVIHPGGSRRDWDPQRATLHIRPSPRFELWGRYDDALNVDHPELVRSQIDVRSWWVGAGGTYGVSDRFRTRAEFGRRELPPGGTVQTMWWLEQTVFLGEGSADPFLRPSVHASGLLGHFSDRDDWVAEAGAGIPAGRYVRLEPRASYGKLVASAPSDERIPARDFRLGLGAWIRPAAGWRIEPRLTYGHLEGPAGASDPLTGDLFDATLRVHVPIVRQVGVDLFGRYQDPPGRESFGEVGGGVWLAVPR